MAEQIVLNWTDPNSVRKVVKVQAPQELAWQVFTQQMGTWWPLAVYKIGKANAVDAIIEPRVGGRWYERGEDGTTCGREADINLDRLQHRGFELGFETRRVASRRH
jgi:hypothetical protein